MWDLKVWPYTLQLDSSEIKIREAYRVYRDNYKAFYWAPRLSTGRQLLLSPSLCLSHATRMIGFPSRRGCTVSKIPDRLPECVSH